MATGTLVHRNDENQVSALQYRAWGYYGYPSRVASTSPTGSSGAAPAVSPVGEVRYVIGWEADQMSRMDWTVLVNGSATWTLTLPSGVTIVSNDEVLVDDETHPRRASNRLLTEAINWTRSMVRQVTTNLFVAGELDYIARATPTTTTTASEVWQVVSVIHPDRAELLASAALRAHGLWPHPADPDRPDAPLFGVLDILEELVWLSRLARAQSRNRVAMRGILGVADGLSFASGGDFWSEWERAMSEPMESPDNVQPLILRGPTELVEPSRAEGMRGLSWIVPQLPYDDKVDVRMNSAIQRLAYGLPTPPEVLLGMQSQSRATAYQVDDNSYRAHVEPAADLVAQVATSALAQVVDDSTTRVQVLPDPTAILARRRTVADTLEAFDRGAVSYDYLREILAIPPDAAPSAADLEQIAISQGGAPSSQGTPAGAPADPGNVAASPPVEETLAAELRGATQQACERARERVGAKLRTRADMRSKVTQTCPNERVAADLGLNPLTLSETGVPLASVIEPAIEGVLSWWAERTEPYQHAEDSRNHLTLALTDHVLATLCQPRATPLPIEDCRKVVEVLH